MISSSSTRLRRLLSETNPARSAAGRPCGTCSEVSEAATWTEHACGLRERALRKPALVEDRLRLLDDEKTPRPRH